MTRVRCMVPAWSHGELCTQCRRACLVGKGFHGLVFAHSMGLDVGALVREWLYRRLGGFYCDLRVVRRWLVVGLGLAGTRVVLSNALSLRSIGEYDGAVTVGARGLTLRDAVKALVGVTGLSPRMSVCGWRFCLDDVDGVDDVEGGAV